MSRILAGLLVLLVAGCAAPEVALPDSPAGRQLRWYMEAVNRTPISEEELKQHFTAGFLKDIPPEKINDLARGLKELRLEKLTAAKPAELAGVTSIPFGQRYDTKISVDKTGKIDFLLFDPA
ncbi:Cpe/LpqF family protein [Nonomuraea typhae]|uniref:Cpe/LpqF family protein n=1 Tax=Nonomuraea typhae TaxID=2603600 RepID=A0ABW7Z6E9_9ACTN